MNQIYGPKKMPILALRGITIFPEQTVHFDVGRMKSALALEDAMKRDQILYLVPQKDILVDDPQLIDLYPIGTVVKVKQVLKSHGENIRVLVDGLYRAKVEELHHNEPYLAGIIAPVNETAVTDGLKARVLRREINNLFGAYLDMSEHNAQAVQLRIMASNNCGFIADTVAQNTTIDYKDK